MELVVTGYAGLYGSLCIYQDAQCGAVLRARYAETFLQKLLEEGAEAERLSALSRGVTQTAERMVHQGQSQAENVSARISAQERGAEENALHTAPDGENSKAALSAFLSKYARAAEDGMLRAAGDGGIFAAMWALLKANRTGAVFSQRSIPILQQTVEVCETFGLDPYRLSAPGCAVWLSSDAGALLDTARAAGIETAVIGHTRKGAGILRTDGPQTAYLRRPEPDEVQKLYDGRLGMSRDGADALRQAWQRVNGKDERS